MSENVIDLDALVPADKKVKFGGVEYVVPGDMPMEVFLKINRAAVGQENGETETEIVEHMIQGMLLLIGSNVESADAKATLEGRLRKLGLGTITSMMGVLYGEDYAAAPEGEEDPTPDSDQSEQEESKTTNT